MAKFGLNLSHYSDYFTIAFFAHATIRPLIIHALWNRFLVANLRLQLRWLLSVFIAFTSVISLHLKMPKHDGQPQSSLQSIGSRVRLTSAEQLPPSEARHESCQRHPSFFTLGPKNRLNLSPTHDTATGLISATRASTDFDIVPRTLYRREIKNREKKIKTWIEKFKCKTI